MDRQRLDRVRQLMADRGVDALLIGPGADMYYLIGRRGRVSERLVALLLGRGGGETVYVPALEAPGFEGSGVQLVEWTDEQDPVELVAGAVRDLGAGTVGIGDQVWSRFLLELQRLLPSVEWTSASEILADSRVVKTPEELELMRRAAAGADAAWAQLVEIKLSGMTEREVAGRIARLLEDEGLEGASFAIVASGPNSASPHHESGDRPLQHGDMVVVDFGGPYQGYQSDITRVLHVGPVSDKEWGVYEAVKEAQQLAVSAVRPGATAASVDAAARSHLERTGLAEYFIHRTGHGLGLDVHEPPYIRGDNQEVLREGMVFSVEPGVYIPSSFGVRIEDIVAVTADGCERLNRASRDLAEVE